MGLALNAKINFSFKHRVFHRACNAVESPAQGAHRPLGVSPEEVTKRIREMENLYYGERLRELELFRMMVKGRLQEAPNYRLPVPERSLQESWAFAKIIAS